MPGITKYRWSNCGAIIGLSVVTQLAAIAGEIHGNAVQPRRELGVAAEARE